MTKRWVTTVLAAFWLMTTVAPGALAQDASSQQASEQQEKEKNLSTAKAVALLEQIVAEATLLKLPENRIRLQIAAADLLWSHNEERARGLFDAAAGGVIELINKPVAASDNRQNFNPRQNAANQARQTANQLRQELVLTVARHNAPMAYQILQTTQPPPQMQSLTATSGANSEVFNVRPSREESLEQQLVAQIAKSDPQMALKSAEEWLDKGQYPGTLAQVMEQLQAKDKDAAAKLTDKVVRRLQSENLLAKQDASFLALALLRPGPRPPESTNSSSTSVDKFVATGLSSSSAMLSEAAFRDLLDSIITAALKATPLQPGAQNSGGGGRGGGRGGQFGGRGGANNPQAAAQTSAQMEASTARVLLAGLLQLMPQVERLLPSRVSAVRQKMTQIGINSEQQRFNPEFFQMMQQGTSESLLAAAQTAPGNMRASLYQQAAMRAIDEGNPDRARQIATQHLNPAQRNSVLQMVDIQQLASKTGDDAIEGIRQALYAVASDDERLRMALQLSATVQTTNAKLALQILEEAQKLVSGRATSYQQFDNQVQVAQAFAALDPARGFDVLEPGINHLNELLSAAALLSGFEVNVFRDGELPMQANSRLTGTLIRFAEQLATLAKSDFERAQTTADRFQLVEARILAKLTIARRLLGSDAMMAGNRANFGGRGFAPNAPFRRQ